jgi:WD40 repeat protein
MWERDSSRRTAHTKLRFGQRVSDSFTYDVFLSHSSKDKPVVRELARRLKDDGLRVWFDEWEIEPGDMIGLKIEQGLEQSRALVLCMSQNAFGSEWVTLERHTALFRDPTNAQRRFIPLRLDDAEIKDALKQFAYLDWREKSENEYARLLASCRLATPPVTRSSETEQQVRLVAVLRGHTQGVHAVAISRSGRRAVSGADDNTVRVWDLDAGRLGATLQGHTDRVWAVAITADGRRAVSGSWDETVRVWDLEASRLIGTLEGHTSVVDGVAITADGRRAVSGSRDNTVRIWDVEPGIRIVPRLEGWTGAGPVPTAYHFPGLVNTLGGAVGPVFSVAIQPDGPRAVSGGADGALQVWDLEAGHLTATLEGHTRDVWGVGITPDGTRAISSSADDSVRVWDLDASRPIATIEGHTGKVVGVAISADGRRAVWGAVDRTVRMWDLETGRQIVTLDGHADIVVGVAITADGRRAVSGSADKTVRVWDLPPVTVIPESR